MTEKQDLPPSFSPRVRMRPGSAGHAWVWIAMAVAVVVFVVLGVWMTRAPYPNVGRDRISDLEIVHQLSARLKDRYRQVPGPPSIYLAQGIAAHRRGTVPASVQRLGMAIALDPDAVDAWLWLVVASAQQPTVKGALTVDDAGALVYAVGQLHPHHPLIPVALGWIALQQGSPERALVSVGSNPATLPGRLLRLRVLGDRVTDTELRNILAMAPAHASACLSGTSVDMDSERYTRVIARLEGCVAAGAVPAVAQRLAELRQTSAIDRPETLDSIEVAD